MRKLSFFGTLLVLSLLVGLVGTTAFADNGNTTTVELSPNSTISLDVTSGDNIDIGDFDPTSDHTWDSGDSTTTVEVDSSKGWQLEISKSASSDDVDNTTVVEDHFQVDPDSDIKIEGHSADNRPGEYDFDVTYGWNAVSVGELEGGSDYTITVTYTVST